MQEIIGQDRPIEFLINSYRQDRLSHAYLFLGPAGVGKSLTAKFFSQFLNCEDRNQAPCLSCSSCQKIEHGNHPDVFWIRPEEGSQGIKIEAIRQLQERIWLKPYEADFKIFILEEADYLLEDAANCLLKTLEEPPPNSLLILVAQRKEKLLPTIVSRCQIVKFLLLKQAAIEEFLIDRYGLEREKAKSFSRMAEGSLAKAVSFLETGCLDKRNVVGEMFWANHEWPEAIWTDRELLGEYIEILLGMARDALCMKLGIDELVMNNDSRELIFKFALSYSKDKLYQLLEKLNSYYDWLKSNANPRLILVNLVMDLEVGYAGSAGKIERGR